MADAVCCDETLVRAGPGPAWRKRHLLVAATPLLTHYMLGDRARYRGTRKNLFDLRRAAVVHNLHVIARQPAAGNYQLTA